MRIGAENSKKTIAASALFIVAIILFIRMISGWSSGPSANTSATANATPRPTQAARRSARKAVHAKGDKTSSGPVTPSLDPRLHLADLRQAEDTVYDGTGRNIFTDTAEPAIPTPKAPPFKEPPKPVPTPQPVAQYVPPPINLKFFGFASGPDHKKVFLSQGDDVFVASEGEIVQRRYKIVKINNNNIEVLDLLSNNRQTIPLTAG